MTDIEELKKRKELLLLECDIARLERKKRFDNAANRWSWLWVVPLGLAGAVFFFAGLADRRGGETYAIMALAALALCPFGIKVLMRR